MIIYLIWFDFFLEKQNILQCNKTSKCKIGHFELTKCYFERKNSLNYIIITHYTLIYSVFKSLLLLFVYNFTKLLERRFEEVTRRQKKYTFYGNNIKLLNANT